MGNIKVSQATKADKNVIKYAAEVTTAPATFEALVEMAEGNELLASSVLLAVRNEARNRTLARLHSLSSAKQPLFTEVDFLAIMTEPTRRLSAAYMVTKLEEDLISIGKLLKDAVQAGDFEEAKRISESQTAIEEQLEEWKVKRETEKAKKAASRAANARKEAENQPAE